MDNPFLSVLLEAEEKNWCSQHFCTTCGAMDFRLRVKALAGSDGKRLADALATVDIGEFTKIPRWPEFLHLTFEFLHDAAQGDMIFGSWIPHLNEHPMLADVVLFYHVRRGILFAPMSLETRKAWIDACAAIALRQKNASLMESLVYTLHEKIGEYPGLKEACFESAAGYPKLQRALVKYNAGGNPKAT